MRGVLAARATFAIGVILGREVARRIGVQRDLRRMAADQRRLLACMRRMGEIADARLAALVTAGEEPGASPEAAGSAP